MNYANIKLADVGNGPGVRVSLFVAGCNHRCPGCFNQLALDFKAGKPFTQETIDLIIEKLRPKHIQGLTFLGGDPLAPQNQEQVLNLITQVRTEYADTKDIWCWTGYVYERDFNADLGRRARGYCEFTDDIFKQIDVLVDGPFVMGLTDPRLIFRGSANQKIIDMKKSSFDEIVLVDVGEKDGLAEEIMSSKFAK